MSARTPADNAVVDVQSFESPLEIADWLSPLPQLNLQVLVRPRERGGHTRAAGCVGTRERERR